MRLWGDEDPEVEPVDDNPEPEVIVDGALELHEFGDDAADELVEARALAGAGSTRELIWAHPPCQPRRW